MKTTIIIYYIIAALISNTTYAQVFTENIRLNQIGYFTNGTKKAIAIDFEETKFEIWKSDTSEKVFSGTMSKRDAWAASCEENIQLADFSDFKTEGEFVLIIGKSKSFPFSISNSVLNNVTKAQMKFFYYNRASTDLLPEYAGKWSRKAGHINTSISVFEDTSRKIDLSGGWYDAGDYGLYMVTGSIAACQLMMAYEQYPNYWNKTNLQIPESYNSVPDILDEVKWELKWMYKMKDTDNGVWYKLTSKNHAGVVMPEDDTSEFYCMVKNVTSAFDYAATFALAARIYKNYETEFPGFSDSCLIAAKEAWDWGIENENVYPSCNNPEGVHTGAYGDGITERGNDNKTLAGTDLFITTGDSVYLKPIYELALNGMITEEGEPNWIQKQPIATMELALHGDSIAIVNVIAYADEQLKYQATNSYNVNIGNAPKEFNWGSNRKISNRATVLMTAYTLTKDEKYITGVINSMDYILGRNATSYCFITGFGSKEVMHPHHRVSQADGIEDPIPGLPIQGPFNGELGHPCTPRIISTCSAKNYFDNECCYVTNEQCIDEGSAHVFNLSGLMDYFTK